MSLFKIFYKSKIFFLSLYFICNIPLPEILAAEESGTSTILSADKQEFSSSLRAALTLNNSSSKINATKDSILFIFESQKKPDKDIKYSFKIEHGSAPDRQQANTQSNEWSEWSDRNTKKYLLVPGHYTILVKTKSADEAEIPAGNFSITVVGKSRIGSEWLIIAPATLIVGILGFLIGRTRERKSIAHSPASTNVMKQNNSGAIKFVSKEEYADFGESGKPFFQKFDLVTVLFADIEGFSEITDSMEPEMLLDALNSFFFYFDTVVDRYRIEKIKTMGDAYMCAGGIPQKNKTNPIEVVLAALEVQNHLGRLRKQNPNIWSVRIGIHTGQVMAGMLGHKKLSFDIWGHTVNAAARLESSCAAGQINIAETTYEAVKAFFDCEYGGKMSPDSNEVSYLVKGLKPQFAEKNADGEIVPNHTFWVQVQLIRLEDLEEHVRNDINGGAFDLPFHNFKHTRDVYEQVELLGQSEGVADEDLLLLKTAALFHDIGYTVTCDDAPAESERIARETLPLFYYDRQQIDAVCRLMKASHYESVPTNVSEQIIHDANLMYYGRADFVTCMMNLFREQREHQSFEVKTEWLKAQIDRLSKHRFYTRAAEKFVSVPVTKQIADTEELLTDKNIT